MPKIIVFCINFVLILAVSKTFGDALDTDFDNYQKYRQFLLERHSAYCQLKINQGIQQLKVHHQYSHIRQSQKSNWSPNNSGIGEKIKEIPAEHLITELIELNYLPEYFYYSYELDPMIWLADIMESKKYGSLVYANYHFKRTVPRKYLKKATKDPHPVIRMQNLRYLTSLPGRRIPTRVIMIALLHERDSQLVPVYVDFLRSRNYFQTPPPKVPDNFKKRLVSLWNSAINSTGRVSAMYLLTAFSDFKAKYPGQVFLETLDRTFPQTYLIELVKRHPDLLKIKPQRLETSDRLAAYIEIAAHFKDQAIVKQRLQHAIDNRKRPPFAMIPESLSRALASWTGKQGLSLDQYIKEFESQP